MKCALLTGLLLLPACQSLYQDAKKPIPDPDFENVSIARSQFDDVPVPEGLTLRTDSLESYSYQCGAFRQARLIYHGSADPARVAAYLRERLPLHGWSATAEAIGKGTRHLEFSKGGAVLLCDIQRGPRRSNNPTVLVIAVRPDLQTAEASASK
ncbi:MAG TPA: hypothetical protein VFI25_14765 [Planctomycetota bacterium]|jgi:hypothetical protein|nr:hypothetical protein [Planctomycetota bacterium]